MGLLGDIVGVAVDVVKKVAGWGVQLLYGGLTAMLDIVYKKRFAKKIAGKILPIVLAGATALGGYWLWSKVVQPAAKWILATSVAGISKLTLGSGLSKSIVIAAFVYKYWTAFYWCWAASMTYGAYVESKAVISRS